MADQLPENPLDSGQTLDFIRSALHPDERQFFKQYLGQESPDIMDYLMPQGRFAKARDMREAIVKGVLTNLIPSATNPRASLGDARGIVPDFPTPPNAKMIPGQAPEQLGPPNQKPAFIGSPNDIAGQATYNGMQEPYFNPRPETAPLVPDPNTMLPRSYQNLLESKIHKAGLRPFSPNSLMKSDAYDRYQEILQGDPEKYPGERTAVGTLAGVITKAPDINSAQGRYAESKAQLVEQTNKRYAGLTDAQIGQLQARQASDNAKARDLNQGFDTRMRELESRITKNNAQGNAAKDLMGVNQQKQQLMQAKMLLALQKSRHARENLDPAEQDYWDNEILKMADAAFEIQRDQPNPFEGFFGMSGDSHIVPKPHLPTPQGQPPSGNPMQFKPGDITSEEQGSIVNPSPITNVQPTPEANPEAKRAQAKALFNTMKDGETKVLDGVKYQRKGTQLIPVQ